MRYELKAVYNPRDEDFDFQFENENYTIPSKKLFANVWFVTKYGVQKLAERILEDGGDLDPVNSSKKVPLMEELTSHEFEIRDLTQGSVVSEASLKTASEPEEKPKMDLEKDLNQTPGEPKKPEPEPETEPEEEEKPEEEETKEEDISTETEEREVPKKLFKKRFSPKRRRNV